jgi:hypothetical protein
VEDQANQGVIGKWIGTRSTARALRRGLWSASASSSAPARTTIVTSEHLIARQRGGLALTRHLY